MDDHSKSEALEKKEILLQLLDTGLVMVHLDPRREGVVVPPQFKDDPVLNLNLAYGFNLPSLEVDDEGVYAVLSFNRADFGCSLPWDAIFAFSCPHASHEGYVWPASLPPELRTEPQAGESQAPEGSRRQGAGAHPPEPPRPRGPALVVHEGRAEGDDPEAPPPDAPRPSTRPKLTVVKG